MAYIFETLKLVDFLFQLQAALPVEFCIQMQLLFNFSEILNFISIGLNILLQHYLLGK